ncbi:hypothetical protein Scep_025542 [Stephania cephalantha]|uniref:Uncharacterized protein n=1 Tax=Stephania cephalantha TaxID=152367 RepID=A0AAP0EQR6_9MAGN
MESNTGDPIAADDDLLDIRPSRPEHILKFVTVGAIRRRVVGARGPCLGDFCEAVDVRYRDLTAASALAGDQDQDAGGGRQPRGVDPLAGKGPHLAAPPPDHRDRNVSGTPPKLVCGSHNPKSGQKQFYRCKGIDISCDVYVGGSPETTIAGGPTRSNHDH